MEFRRRQQESKREYYRRIAKLKKQTWATEYCLQEGEAYKSHFLPQQKESTHDVQKSKKIDKVEYQTEQRLRNRVAAQDSRERHRVYVEDLEQKVQQYKELMETWGGLCKRCRKPLLTEMQDVDSMMVESVSSPKESSIATGTQPEQDLLNSYLDDQVIRIDNQGATSPFGVFFVLCFMAVFTVFTINSGSPSDITPRLLTSSQSTLNQLIDRELDQPHQKYPQSTEHSPRMETIKHHETADLGRLPSKGSSLFEAVPALFHNSVPVPNNMGHAEDSISGWTKYGKFMCSEPELLFGQETERMQAKPEFLLLRTGKNKTQAEEKSELGQQDNDEQNFRILPQEWQSLEVSSCFLEEL